VRRTLVIAAAAALALVGCSGEPADSKPATSSTPTTPSTPTESPTIENPSPADAWVDAVASTRGQVSVESQLITNVEGFERILAGVGFVDIDSEYGDIAWSDEFATTREIQTADGHFLELDGTWFALDSETGVPTKVGFTPLEGLDSATNVTLVGDEEVVDTSATRFDADLDPSLGPLTMGFSGEELTVVNDATDASLVATIWVDDEGRIVRILREYSASSPDGDPISATSLYLLSDFTDPTPIDVPETADAIPAPA